MGMTVNFSDFDKGLKKVVEDVAPRVVAKGLFAAGNELLRDAVKKPKTAPKMFGDLWGSARVNEAKIEKGQISVEAGFNIEYATVLHEGQRKDGSYKITKWTTDKGSADPGVKFLESKMVQFKDNYMKVVAEFLKEALK